MTTRAERKATDTHTHTHIIFLGKLTCATEATEGL